MELKKCRKGEVVIRQGETGRCMYSIRWGRVAVYSGYGTAGEKRLAELGADDFFGEMELADPGPRSATVVALDAGTTLEVITEQDFRQLFTENRPKVFLILQRMCQKLRKTTQDYMQVCHTIARAMEQPESRDEALSHVCRLYREQA